MEETKIVVFEINTGDSYEIVALVEMGMSWSEEQIRKALDAFLWNRVSNFGNRPVIKGFLEYLVETHLCKVVPHESIRF